MRHAARSAFGLSVALLALGCSQSDPDGDHTPVLPTPEGGCSPAGVRPQVPLAVGSLFPVSVVDASGTPFPAVRVVASMAEEILGEAETDDAGAALVRLTEGATVTAFFNTATQRYAWVVPDVRTDAAIVIRSPLFLTPASPTTPVNFLVTESFQPEQFALSYGVGGCRGIVSPTLSTSFALTVDVREECRQSDGLYSAWAASKAVTNEILASGALVDLSAPPAAVLSMVTASGPMASFALSNVPTQLNFMSTFLYPQRKGAQIGPEQSISGASGVFSMPPPEATSIHAHVYLGSTFALGTVIADFTLVVGTALEVDLSSLPGIPTALAVDSEPCEPVALSWTANGGTGDFEVVTVRWTNFIESELENHWTVYLRPQDPGPVTLTLPPVLAGFASNHFAAGAGNPSFEVRRFESDLVSTFDELPNAFPRFPPVPSTLIQTYVDN